MYTDLYLAFNSEAEAKSVLYDGEIPKYQNIDILGTVYQPIPNDAPESYEPVPYPSPNYGVNVRVVENENIDVLMQYNVSPSPFPQRVWA